MLDRKEYTPKLFTLLREGISLTQLRADLVSGVIVGVVALPLAIAFAIASGVSPEKGLITAIFAGFIISVFGGSRVQIGGPTGAFIVIVFGIVQQYGIEGLTIATFMAGFILMAMGLLRFGSLLKFIPHPLVVGFTSGIAVIIFSSQIRDFLGLSMSTVPAAFVEKWAAYAQHLESVNFSALAIGAGTVIITMYFVKITTRIPGSLAAIILATAIAQWFHLPVDTIGTRFGDIPSRIPMPHFYLLSWEQIKGLLSPAFAIAILGAIESLLSAVVADGMVGGRHRSNMELVAQGAANIVSAIMGGIPATGAIARTATNVKNGGRTPVSGIVHAITLLLIMLVAAPFARHIPMACLAGILVVVAWNMGEWHAFSSVFRGNVYDRMVLLTVFLLTVFFDLIIAIEIGMVLAAFLFIKRMSDLTQINVLEQGNANDTLFEKEYGPLPKGVLHYEVSGPLFFGASQQFQEALRQTNQRPRAVLLNLRNVSLIDATGLYRFGDLVKSFHNRGTRVYITDYSEAVGKEMADAGFPQWAQLTPSPKDCIQAISDAL